MKKLQRTVNLAAILSITATTAEAREQAATQRVRAAKKIDRAQAQLNKLRAVLALFPPVEVNA
jgi:hypothetical protein